jgi:hypothetical protein
VQRLDRRSERAVGGARVDDAASAASVWARASAPPGGIMTSWSQPASDWAVDRSCSSA